MLVINKIRREVKKCSRHFTKFNHQLLNERFANIQTRQWWMRASTDGCAVLSPRGQHQWVLSIPPASNKWAYSHLPRDSLPPSLFFFSPLLTAVWLSGYYWAGQLRQVTVHICIHNCTKQAKSNIRQCCPLHLLSHRFCHGKEIYGTNTTACLIFPLVSTHHQYQHHYNWSLIWTSATHSAFVGILYCAHNWLLDQLVLTNRLCWHHRIFCISPAISICFCLLAMHCKSPKGWECENEWGSDGDRETKEPCAVCNSPLDGVVGAAATHIRNWNDNWVHLVLIWMHTSTHIQTPPILISIPQRSPHFTSHPPLLTPSVTFLLSRPVSSFLLPDHQKLLSLCLLFPRYYLSILPHLPPTPSSSSPLLRSSGLLISFGSGHGIITSHSSSTSSPVRAVSF